MKIETQDVERPDLPAVYDDLWSAVVRGAIYDAEGPPSMTHLHALVHQHFSAALVLYGNDGGAPALERLLKGLEQFVDDLRDMVQAAHLAEDYDLPTVEELERTDWKIHRAEPATWRETFAKMPDDPLPYTGDPDAPDATSISQVEIPCMVQKRLDRGGRTVVCGLGLNVEVEAICLFSNRG